MNSPSGGNEQAKFLGLIFRLSFIIPFVMGGIGWILGSEASPETPSSNNYIALSGKALMLISLLLFPLSYFIRWDMRAKCYGTLIFPLSCSSLIGIYPIASIVQYSALPLWMRITFLFANLAVAILWCSRFIRSYRYIFEDSDLYNLVYEERPDSVYFYQEGDKEIFEKLLKFSQQPPALSYLIFIVLAFSLVPFGKSVSVFFGIPFIHVFLAVLGMPIVLLMLGITTKIWLTFYYYPIKIKWRTGKTVYVDSFSKPLGLSKVIKEKRSKLKI